jgi:hypothetical protein
MKKAQKAGKHQKECRKQRQEITAGARGNNKPKGHAKSKQETNCEKETRSNIQRKQTKSCTSSNIDAIRK